MSRIKDPIEVLSELMQGERSSFQDIECRLSKAENPLDDPMIPEWVDLVERAAGKWGDPAYEGTGPRWGLPGSGRGAWCDAWTSQYRSAGRIAIWQVGTFRLAIMVTGHDADSLLCLAVEATLLHSAGPPLPDRGT